LDASVPGEAARKGWAPRASASVTVGTEPVTGIELLIGTPASASGRFVFEGSSELPPAGESRFTLMPHHEGADCRSFEDPQIRPDWTFEVRHLWGSCQINAWTGGRWMLKAVMHEGVNLTDRAIEFKPGVQLRDLRIVFTDRRTELNFEVSDDRGLPTREFVAIAFRADTELWSAQRGQVRTYTPPIETEPASRGPIGGIPTGLPGPDGRSRSMMPALPPADYFVVAVDDVSWEDLQEPEVLEELSKAAIRITLAPGESRTLQLRRIAAPGIGEW
jgi:hypothetical protein